MSKRTCLAALLALAVCLPSMAVEPGPLLATLREVGPKGAGHEAAIAAWKELARADVARLPEILAGLDEAGPLGANWIRAAVDVIAERQLRSGGKLPAAELEKFLLDISHAPRGRRLAYEWLAKVDPSAEDRLIPGMLDDPSLAMRRDAVARLIGKAAALIEANKPSDALPIYRRALTSARDLDQIKLLAARLEKAGQPVDLPRHFGFIVSWKLIGPFDNTGEKGFDVVYPPEKKVDFAASCPGKGREVKWVDFTTKDKYGLVDLNKGLCEEKEVVGYAAAEFISPGPREVEFRVASYSAVKLWLNGKLIDKHNVYHGGSNWDQYISRGKLRAGRNLILLKVCQNAQTQSWARVWQFKLRVCDEQGTAVLSRVEG